MMETRVGRRAKSGRHPQAALTAVRVRNEKRPGRYADGNGLYLEVDKSGARRWILRLMINRKRRDLGLGSAYLVPLAEVRETARLWRKSARAGRDPKIEFGSKISQVPTFREVAKQTHEGLVTNYRNEKHAAQWIKTLETYVFPTIGDLQVDQIATADIHRLISQIWTTKAETAQRVLQRIKLVFDRAKSSGFRSGDNPVDGVKQGLAKRAKTKRHHPAMPFVGLPDFVGKLRKEKGQALTHLPMEFLILTAARTSEVLKATWNEVDLSARVWTIPGERMKAGREHRVPLSNRALDILKSARTFNPVGQYIFPGRSVDKPLSNMALLEVMRRHSLDYVPHGFRSSFRDWAGETTQHPHDVCEMALAHTIKNKAEAAYRRGDMLERRRILMEDWARYIYECNGQDEQSSQTTSAKVQQI